MGEITSVKCDDECLFALHLMCFYNVTLGGKKASMKGLLFLHSSSCMTHEVFCAKIIVVS